MDDAAVQVDLVGLADLGEDLLGLVALLGGEDLVGLSGGNGQGARNSGELVLLDERGVGNVADLDAILVVADDILLGGPVSNLFMLFLTMYTARSTYLRTKAVTQRSDLSEALSFQKLQTLLDNWVDGVWGVRVLAVGALGEPFHEVKVAGAVKRERVAVEDVNDQSVVAVGGKLIGHQLAVLPDADDVWDVQQCGAVVLVVALGFGDVSFILTDFDTRASGLAAG